MRQHHLQNGQRSLRSLTAIAIFAMAFSLVGASCSKQDPLASQSEDVRNGTPPSQKPDTAPPPDEGLLRVRAEDYISFQEDVEGKTKITGALLQSIGGHEPVAGQDFEVIITNLSDFGGAAYDAVTGEFKWKPAKGFTEQNYTRQASLDVTIATLTLPVVVSKSVKIPVWVTRAKNIPEITKIDINETTPVREGEKLKFTVTVRDAAAINQDNMRPRLMILPGRTNSAGAGSVAASIYQDFEVPSVDPNDSQLYTFKMVVDLKDKELTTTKDSFSFSVQAINRYGEPSSSLTKSVLVVTSLRAPRITVGDAVTVIRGQENTINFSVYDPFNESYLEVDFERCSLLSGETSCTCVTSRSQGATSTQNCTLFWKPSLTQATGIVDKQISIQQKTKVTNDTILPVTTKAIIRMNVVKGPNESAPTPAPTATPVASVNSGGAQ